MRKLTLALWLALLAASPASAAVTANSVVTAQTPNRGIVQFLQGTDAAGTYKTLYTAGANGSKCFGGYMTSNDATAHLVTFQLVNGGVRYGGTAISTGTSTPGFASGVGALQVTSPTVWPGLPLDSDGNPYISMISGDTLQATYATTLTSTDFINVVITCSDF
jgi:hypothetical protein